MLRFIGQSEHDIRSSSQRLFDEPLPTEIRCCLLLHCTDQVCVRVRTTSDHAGELRIRKRLTGHSDSQRQVIVNGWHTRKKRHHQSNEYLQFIAGERLQSSLQISPCYAGCSVKSIVQNTTSYSDCKCGQKARIVPGLLPLQNIPFQVCGRTR